MPVPFLSVIIPVYNAHPYLRECLDSLRKQTLRDWEAILVDDGSTDGSDEVMHYFADLDRRFRCIWQANSGPSAARNRGLWEAQGKYVAFLDCDDCLLAVDVLELILMQLEKSGADVAVGHVWSVHPEGKCKLWGGRTGTIVHSRRGDGRRSLLYQGVGKWMLRPYALYLYISAQFSARIRIGI